MSPSCEDARKCFGSFHVKSALYSVVPQSFCPPVQYYTKRYHLYVLNRELGLYCLIASIVVHIIPREHKRDAMRLPYVCQFNMDLL